MSSYSGSGLVPKSDDLVFGLTVILPSIQILVPNSASLFLQRPITGFLIETIITVNTTALEIQHCPLSDEHRNVLSVLLSFNPLNTQRSF